VFAVSVFRKARWWRNYLVLHRGSYSPHRALIAAE
jgi:hypothetical protein